MQPIRVTAYSIVNSLGVGRNPVVESLRARRSGLHPCDFDTVDLDTYIGRVPALDEIKVRTDLERYDCRNNRLAQLALETDGFADAVRAARERYGADRVGVFLGTSTSGLLQAELAYRERDPMSGALPEAFAYASTQNNFSLAAFVHAYLGLSGPAVTVSSACSSSAKVFGNAARMMVAGLCDAAVVGGVDTLCLTTLYGFNSLQLLSRTPCRPFDAQRDGISIGEGAGFALLEKAGAADNPLLLGIGESSDAHHMSTPHPEGLGASLAMQRALAAAALNASDIDYLNLHGTASKSNDAAEDKAVSHVFGRSTPVSSTKGYTGHLLGAAGITEAIIALLAIEQQMLPGSVHTQTLDPSMKSNYLLNNVTTRVKRVLSNSFGFGGSNCSLVLGVRD
ncbi:MAG: beta-ketoacyl-[acyl-carrier-protein] synthase family protein [Pseudomonadota bacterium]